MIFEILFLQKNILSCFLFLCNSTRKWRSKSMTVLQWRITMRKGTRLFEEQQVIADFARCCMTKLSPQGWQILGIHALWTLPCRYFLHTYAHVYAHEHACRSTSNLNTFTYTSDLYLLSSSLVLGAHRGIAKLLLKWFVPKRDKQEQPTRHAWPDSRWEEREERREEDRRREMRKEGMLCDCVDEIKQNTNWTGEEERRGEGANG